MTCIEASTCFDNEWYSCDSATGVVTKGKSCKTQSDGNTVCGTQLDECVAATPAACEPKCEEVTDGSVKKVKVTTCSETGVATTNEYTDKSCKSATEVGVCLNDAKRCATGSTVGIETCANGEWGTAVACSSTDADAETFECVAEATCKIKTCKNDKTPSEDGLTCVAGGGTTPAPNPTAWVDVVAYTATQLKTGNYAKCVGVSNASGQNYLNCGQFPADFDPSTMHIAYALTPTDIANLVGKSWIAADFSIATKNSTLTKAHYQFFVDGAGLGVAGEIALNGNTFVNVEKYVTNIGTVTNIELRIWPDPQEAKGDQASRLRLNSLKLYAQ